MLNNHIIMHNIEHHIIINSINPVFFLNVRFSPLFFPLSSHAATTTYTKPINRQNQINRPQLQNLQPNSETILTFPYTGKPPQNIN